MGGRGNLAGQSSNRRTRIRQSPEDTNTQKTQNPSCRIIPSGGFRTPRYAQVVRDEDDDGVSGVLYGPRGGQRVLSSTADHTSSKYSNNLSSMTSARRTSNTDEDPGSVKNTSAEQDSTLSQTALKKDEERTEASSDSHIRITDPPMKQPDHQRNQGGTPTALRPGEDRPSSGCSFTSSEVGEDSPSKDTPPSPEKREEVAFDRSSGYVSRRSIEAADKEIVPNHSKQQQQHGGEDQQIRPQPRPSHLPVHAQKDGKDSIGQDTHLPGRTPHQPYTNAAYTSGALHGAFYRQSSAQSETLSSCSARTASPATKIRLLDMVSTRALERDGSESLQSWSCGSEDTLSLGTSCSGFYANATASAAAAAATGPVFGEVGPKRRGGS